MGGFVAGGPAGAAAGYSLGKAAGDKLTESASSKGSGPTTLDANGNVVPVGSPGAGGVQGVGYQMNPAAWDTPASAGYGTPIVTPVQQGQLDNLDKRIAILSEDVKNNPGLQAALNLAIQQKQDLQTQIAKNPQTDTRQLAANAKDAANRAAPTMADTRIDFSGAAPQEQRVSDLGDLQRQQAQTLMTGASGAGQQALIDRLNRDLEGGAPSLAEQQLLEGRDIAMANSLSLANSARGPTQGLTQLEALRANQNLMQQTTRQQAELRAQEYAQAREALGTVLGQQRTAGIQEQNVAANELGGAQRNEATVLADKYNNAVQQGLITSSEAKAKLDAELRQRGLNDTQVQYYTNQYFGQQNRAQDMAVNRETALYNQAHGYQEVGIAQQNANTNTGELAEKSKEFGENRTDKYVGAAAQGASTLGQSYIDSQSGKPGNTGAPGTGTPAVTPKDTGYQIDDGIKDPYEGGQAA